MALTSDDVDQLDTLPALSLPLLPTDEIPVWRNGQPLPLYKTTVGAVAAGAGSTTIINGGTVTLSDLIEFVLVTAVPATINLNAAQIPKEVTIKDGTGTASNIAGITVVPPNPALIDGAASFLMNLNWEAISLLYQGGSWYIV